MYHFRQICRGKYGKTRYSNIVEIVSTAIKTTRQYFTKSQNGTLVKRNINYLRRSDNPGLRYSRLPAPQSYRHPKSFNNEPASDAAIAPVSIPEDPYGVLTKKNISPGLASILDCSALVVVRQIEMLNIFMGFEQANKYALLDPQGNYVGYIAEETSFTSTIFRQLFRTHRAVRAMIMDAEGEIVLKIRRPFAWINSRLFVTTDDENLIGEVQQQWHLWRRRYNLFVRYNQFARIDAGFWSWNFYLEDERGGLLGNVTRNFTGFGREIFTDTGQYVIRMDAAEGQVRGMTLDERAITLGAAISIDFDYFSRHSQHGSAFPLFPFIIGGGRDDEYYSD
ncbi:hypothetical protein G9A89_017853 [Geosiphon pyriformis]|nr:hypothetical protein G9A89_017853 [Geosiphon pyriformis]